MIFFLYFCLSYSDVFVSVLFYFILFLFIPWKPVCFLMADRKGVNSDGKGGKKELERVQGGRMVIRIEYMKKNPLFNKRKKNK